MSVEATKLLELAESVREKGWAREPKVKEGDAHVLVLLGNWMRLARQNAIAVARICEADDQPAETAARQVRGLLELRIDVAYVLKVPKEVQQRAEIALAHQVLQHEQLHNRVLTAQGNFMIADRLEAKEGVERALSSFGSGAVAAARKRLKRGHWSGEERKVVVQMAGLPKNVHEITWKSLSIAEHGMQPAYIHVALDPEHGKLYIEMSKEDAERVARQYCLMAAKLLTEIHNFIGKYFDLPFVINSLPAPGTGGQRTGKVRGF